VTVDENVRAEVREVAVTIAPSPSASPAAAIRADERDVPSSYLGEMAWNVRRSQL
jgi:hypothetical protein